MWEIVLQKHALQQCIFWLSSTYSLQLTFCRVDCCTVLTWWLWDCQCGLIPGPRFNIKITSHPYRKSHCGDKTIVRLSYLHSGISYTGKMTSLYWIRRWPLIGCYWIQLVWWAFISLGWQMTKSLRPSDSYMRQKLTIIGSNNGLSPGQCQAIIWTKAGILLIEH